MEATEPRNRRLPAPELLPGQRTIKKFFSPATPFDLERERARSAASAIKKAADHEAKAAARLSEQAAQQIRDAEKRRTRMARKRVHNSTIGYWLPGLGWVLAAWGSGLLFFWIE